MDVKLFSYVAAVLMMVMMASAAQEETTRLPTSWNRCSCSVAPEVKSATEKCSSQKGNAALRDCILKNLGVYDGTTLDYGSADGVIGKFNATAVQKESLKKSIGTCKAQSRNDPEKERTCAADVLRKRCLTDPKTVCNQRD